MDIPSYTFHVKEVDLKKFVNFDRVLHKPTEGSKVSALHVVLSQILEQLDERGMLPISVIQFSDLARQGCYEWGVELNKRFIRTAIASYIKGRDEYQLVHRGKFQVDIDRR